jgi:FdrA protein
MQIYNLVRKNTYYDSVTLMLISKQLKQLKGIDDVSVMMGTPANRVILQEASLLEKEGEMAGPSDLILAFRAPADIDVDQVCSRIDEQLKKKAEAGTKEPVAVFRTAERAYRDLPAANLAVISVPGDYAAIEAERALKCDKHVFLFSDNVSLEEEVKLKRLAAERGLLVMGPDCGTAIINGVGIGFANRVRSGNVGIVAASGTGLQEVSCLLDAMDLGISQAIGTGGRDLKEEVGASTMLQGIDLLLSDAATEIIVLISKPPAEPVVARILARLTSAEKSAVLCFIGHQADSPPHGVMFAATLEEAALKAASLSGIRPRLLTPEDSLTEWANAARKRMAPRQRYLRALYAGGTLCYEAMLIASQRIGPIYSNIPIHKQFAIHDVLKSGHHSAVDLGDDEFTKGRPHPMIDGTLRNEYIANVADDPETAVLLLDVVIGFGASDDPAGELAPVIEAARGKAEAMGNEIAVVTYVCGTDRDEQGKHAQISKLQSSGAFVARTNAEAARLASMIIDGMGAEGHGCK